MKAAEIRSLYETDYYTWTQETARLLRSGRMDEIDREALAEEVEDLGKSEKRALASQFKRLHAHLLKWAFTQKSGHKNSWKASIEDSRSEIEKILSENPGLKSQTAEIFRTSYRGGGCWRSRNLTNPKAFFQNPARGRSRRPCPPSFSRRINEPSRS